MTRLPCPMHGCTIPEHHAQRTAYNTAKVSDACADVENALVAFGRDPSRFHANDLVKLIRDLVRTVVERPTP